MPWASATMSTHAGIAAVALCWAGQLFAIIKAYRPAAQQNTVAAGLMETSKACGGGSKEGVMPAVAREARPRRGSGRMGP